MVVIITLSFNKFERNKKTSLQFIGESGNYYFLKNNLIAQPEEKYCKEKLNKIII